MPRRRKRRTPQLRYTANRGIGWYASYRDRVTGSPRRQRFGRVSEEEARVLYYRWLADHLNEDAEPKVERGRPTTPKSKPKSEGPVRVPMKKIVPGSLLEVASAWLEHEKSRTRQPDEPRARGTIHPAVYSDHCKQVHDFLDYLNRKHGQGMVGRMKLADLEMADVEGYNRAIVEAGYSSSQISKRMQIVKALIDQAGRAEHGYQTLTWNWDSRRAYYGKPSAGRQLPTVNQLKRILKAGSVRERAMVWMAIGLGFGQSDLAAVRVGCVDEERYDLRRMKTGIERYGETPPMVWKAIQSYQRKYRRPHGELLFVTRKGLPLVHNRSDSVQQWWLKLRAQLGETKDTLSGFYVLRHLGATEYGSRPGCSISEMRRWLGHGASSAEANVYMKPVSPEYREVIEWVRKALQAGKADLRLPKKQEQT
ncbi:MAG: tyrosine-type recombinase/integrase [bacterium]